MRVGSLSTRVRNRTDSYENLFCLLTTTFWSHFRLGVFTEIHLVIMANSFDVNDRNSWYFGAMSRQDATDLLMQERDGGVFLVRDSNTIVGDYVLCVKEDAKVSHYIINKIQHNQQQIQTVYRIGDNSFVDLPELLEFYKLHYLDTTSLRRPVQRKVEKVIAKFDFEGSVSLKHAAASFEFPLNSLKLNTFP